MWEYFPDTALVGQRGRLKKVTSPGAYFTHAGPAFHLMPGQRFTQAGPVTDHAARHGDW